MSDDYDFGPCCVCGGEGPAVRNIMLLDFYGPTPGAGWGCLQCGLPQDGATAVVCDDCMEAGRDIRFVLLGKPADKARLPIEDLEKRPFEHRLEMHPEAAVWEEGE